MPAIPGRRLGMLPAWVGMISPLVGRIFLHGVDQNRGSSLPTIINSKVSGPLKEDMEQDMEAQDTEHRARRGQVMQQMAISNLKIIPTTHRIIRANMLSKFAHH